MSAPDATSTAPQQQEVFDFLGRGAGDTPVVQIDTHGAAVFLEGNRALKIKRPTRLSRFLPAVTDSERLFERLLDR